MTEETIRFTEIVTTVAGYLPVIVIAIMTLTLIKTVYFKSK